MSVGSDPVIRAIRRELDRIRSDGARIDVADVTDNSPLMVTYDGGVSEQSAYAPAGVVPSVGDRVTVIKAGNSPGLVLGVTSDEPGGSDPGGSYEETVGDGSTTTFTVTHNLADLDVDVSVYTVSTGEERITEFARVSPNAVEVRFVFAPPAASRRVVVKR